MNRGKGKSLLGIGATVVAVAAIGVAMLSAMDAHEAYSDTAQAVRELNAQHLDGYFACALSGSSRSAPDSEGGLHSALEIEGERLGVRYARQLERCEGLLAPLGDELERLQVPLPLAAEHDELVRASQALHAEVGAYEVHLMNAGEYDYVQAAPFIDRIAKAWGRLETARDALLAGTGY